MSGINFPTVTTSSSTGSSFSAPKFSFATPVAAATTTTTANAPISLNFGTTNTGSATAPGQISSLGLTTPASCNTVTIGSALNFGSFTSPGFGTGIGAFNSGAPTNTQSSCFVFSNSSLAPNTTSITLATKTSVGLGGINLTSSQQKHEQKTDTSNVKENKVPQEILKSVNDLKSYIKEQKAISSEIARTSVRKLSNVTKDIDTVNYELEDISDGIKKTYMQLKSLKNDTSKAIQNVEMAKQTSETPSNFQYENTAPLKYFQELIQKYENEILKLRNQIELTENQMKSITYPQSLTPEDLKRGLKQIHECFVALAGRLHEIHRRVENAKEQYESLRINLTNETDHQLGDIDDNTCQESDVSSKLGSGGPSPFTMLTGMNLAKFCSTNGGRNSTNDQ